VIIFHNYYIPHDNFRAFCKGILHRIFTKTSWKFCMGMEPRRNIHQNNCSFIWLSIRTLRIRRTWR